MNFKQSINYLRFSLIKTVDKQLWFYYILYVLRIVCTSPVKFWVKSHFKSLYDKYFVLYWLDFFLFITTHVTSAYCLKSNIFCYKAVCYTVYCIRQISFNWPSVPFKIVLPIIILGTGITVHCSRQLYFATSCYWLFYQFLTFWAEILFVYGQTINWKL